MAFRRSDGVAVAVLTVLVALLLAGPLLAPGGLLYSPGLGRGMDLVQQQYPWRLYLRRSLLDGALPRWNPYTFLGQPFVANVQVGAFAPPLVLSLLLPVAYAATLTVAGSLLLAGVGTYYFARRIGVSPTGGLVAGVAFAFGGPTTARLVTGHLTVLAAAALVPWVYLAFHRAVGSGSLRDAALAGGVVGVQFLCGHPQTSHHTLVTVTAYLLVARAVAVDAPRRAAAVAAVRRVGRVLVVAGVVSALVSAVQLLPALALLRLGTRGELSLATAGQGALSPARVLVGLLPRLFGTGVHPLLGPLEFGRYWQFAYHVGVVPLLLVGAALGRRRREPAVAALAVVGGLALALAAGPVSPLYRLHVAVVPGGDLFRLPSRYLAFLTLALAVLAGVGHDVVAAGAPRSRLASRLPVALGGLLVLVGLAAATVDTSGTSGSPRLVVLVEVGVALGSLLTGVVLLRAYRAGRGPPRALRAAVVAVVAAYLLFYAAPTVGVAPVDRAVGPPATPASDGRLYDATPWATDPALPGPYVNHETNTVHRRASVGGYNPQVTAHSLTLPRAVSTEGYDRRLDVLNVSHVVAYPANASTDSGRVRPATLRAAPGYTRVGADRFRIDGTTRTAVVFRNDRTLPRAFHLPGVDAARPDAVAARDRAVPLRFERGPGSNRLVATGPVDRAGVVVVSESWYPFWHARVDGEPAPVERTAGGLMAVPVDAGAERVTLVYRSWPLRVGAVLSVLGAAVVALAAAAPLRERA